MERRAVPFLAPAGGRADERQAATVQAEFSAQLEANLSLQLARNSTALDRLIVLTEQLLAKRKPVPVQRFYYLTVGAVGNDTKHDDWVLPKGESWFVDQIQIIAFAGVTGNPVVTIEGVWPVALPLVATLNVPYVLECRIDAELDQHLDLSVASGTGTVLVIIRYARAE